MKTSYLLIFLFAIVVGLAASRTEAQVLNLANGHYYQAVSMPSGVNWYTANTNANSLMYNGFHGHLATITSAAENAYIYANLPVVHDWWLGGYQPAGSQEPGGGWRWVTGETWNYTNWNPVQPDDCGGTEDGLEWWADGTWNDGTRTMSSASFGYIVEYETVPEPSNCLPVFGGLLALGGVMRRRTH